MERQVINFRAADGQQLEMLTPFKSFAIDTVNYVQAHFELCENWREYSELFAVWYIGNITKASEIDADGTTIIPAEVLARPGILTMNLCANLTEDNILKARLTSYPVDVLKLTRTKK